MVEVAGRHPYDREILRLAVPALGALIAEPVFLLTDSAIVGHLGTVPLAALGVAATALATLVNASIFLAYGTTAAVARRLGAGDPVGAVRQGIDGLWLAAGIGITVAVLTATLSHRLATVLGADGAVADAAATYLRISSIGVPAMLVVLAATGVLRGLQDTRTPLVVAVAAAAVNVVLEVAFVFGLHLGLAGSAWGTVVAQLGAAGAYVWIVGRGARATGAPLRPDLAGIRAAGHAGAPLIVRTVALRGVLVVATAVAARMGATTLAAYQVTFTVWSALTIAMDAIAIAGQALVGRFLGAGDVVAARAATQRMLWWGVTAGVVLGGLLAVVSPLLPRVFSTDADVRTAIASGLLVVAALQPLGGPVFVLDGVLIGAGDARFLAGAAVVTLAAFVPAALAVATWGGGLVALWAGAMGVFLGSRLLLLGWRARGDAWLVTGAVRA